MLRQILDFSLLPFAQLPRLPVYSLSSDMTSSGKPSPMPFHLPSPTAGCVPQQGIQGVLHSVTVHLLVSLVDQINLLPMIQYRTLSGTIYNTNNLIDSP